MALALTEDFVTFERFGLIMQPDDKDAALLPRRIDGHLALLHRPIADSGAHVWISYSPDLHNWGNHKMMLQARRGGDTLHIYYGAADTSIALATASVKELLAWLDENGAI